MHSTRQSQVLYSSQESHKVLCISHKRASNALLLLWHLTLTNVQIPKPLWRYFIKDLHKRKVSGYKCVMVLLVVLCNYFSSLTKLMHIHVHKLHLFDLLCHIRQAYMQIKSMLKGIILLVAYITKLLVICDWSIEVRLHNADKSLFHGMYVLSVQYASKWKYTKHAWLYYAHMYINKTNGASFKW